MTDLKQRDNDDNETGRPNDPADKSFQQEEMQAALEELKIVEENAELTESRAESEESKKPIS